MSGVLRSEFLKLRTTRTTTGQLLAALGIVVLTTVVRLVLGAPERSTDLSIYDESTQRSRRRRLGREEIVGIALGLAAAGALWAVIDVGVGALVRSQVGAIVTVIAWSVVESILIGVVPRVGRLTPGEAANAVCGADGNLLSPAAGRLD